MIQYLSDVIKTIFCFTCLTNFLGVRLACPSPRSSMPSSDPMLSRKILEDNDKHSL